MNLIENQEILHRDLKHRGELVPVGQNAEFLIAFSETHIEALVIILRDTADSRAESMHQKIAFAQ